MSALEKAREKVRSLKFGTKEWECAMQVVRDLVDAENANADFGQLKCDSDGKWWD